MRPWAFFAIGLVIIIQGVVWAVALDSEVGTTTGYVIAGVYSLGLLFISVGIAIAFYNDFVRDYD